MLRVFTIFGILGLAACTAVRYDLPPVADGPATGARTGKFIWHDLISDDPEGSQAFYGALFDWRFESLALLGADYWVISHQGTPIGGMVHQASLPARKDISQWISVLAVADPDSAVRATRAAGGRVLREPVDIGRRGTIAVLADPEGAIFAALDTDGADPADSDDLPPEGAFFWHELWTSNVNEVSDYYAALGGLSVDKGSMKSPDGGVIAFNLLRGDDWVRAGIRDLPAPDMPPLWMPYLRIADRSTLDAMLDRVEGLGGAILVPVTARPERGFVAVIAGPSGAPIALQTWGDEGPTLKEL